MPYFQNVSNSEFIGVYVVSDRKYSKDYRVKPNQNTSALMVSQAGPFDLTTANLFGIKYSPNAGTDWYQVSVTLTSGSARTAMNVADDLNTNTSFAAMFGASVSGDRLVIRAVNHMNHNFRAYIPNLADPLDASTSAEQKLKFNLKAPVAEMPSYFSRYAIGNMPGALLVELTQPDEDFVITNAGLSTTPKEDWEFLEGTSGLFTFKKQTVDSSSRVTQIIEYPCGARAGDLAKKINMTYSGAKTQPDNITEIPYTLESGDLITPP